MPSNHIPIPHLLLLIVLCSPLLTVLCSNSLGDSRDMGRSSLLSGLGSILHDIGRHSTQIDPDRRLTGLDSARKVSHCPVDALINELSVLGDVLAG